MTETKEAKKKIGERIKTLRLELGMSQEELAIKIGYKAENARSTISKIESGTNDIAQTKLPIYAQVLHTTIPYLLGIDDSPDAKYDCDRLTKEVKLLQQINEILGSEMERLVTTLLQIAEPKRTETIKYVIKLVETLSVPTNQDSS